MGFCLILRPALQINAVTFFDRRDKGETTWTKKLPRKLNNITHQHFFKRLIPQNSMELKFLVSPLF